MNYLLDTHVWIWWQAVAEKIVPQVRETLTNLGDDDQLFLSAISVWELAKLVEKGHLKLRTSVDEWTRQALEMPRLQLLPLSPAISIESTRLPQPFHDDPADQIVVASARLTDSTVISADRQIQNYAHVHTLW
jgi:PIN domain nuclease of toxin-antitoxin system